MKYTKKERVEIQEVYEKYILNLTRRLALPANYLCHMIYDLRIYFRGSIKECGWNDRILPNAITYLHSEKPTVRKNKDFYNSEHFITNRRTSSWWEYSFGPPTLRKDTVNIAVNQEKIRFLNHLIKKLR